MKCQSCGNPTRINYGSSGEFLCAVCAEDGAKSPAAGNQIPAATDGSTTISGVQPISSNYGAARSVAFFVAFVGWGIVALGVTSVIALVSPYYYFQMEPLLVFLGVAVSVSGLLLVAAAQVTRATVENADHTREILNVLRQNQIHK